MNDTKGGIKFKALNRIVSRRHQAAREKTYSINAPKASHNTFAEFVRGAQSTIGSTRGLARDANPHFRLTADQDYPSSESGNRA
jgi:hypothetical protein